MWDRLRGRVLAALESFAADLELLGAVGVVMDVGQYVARSVQENDQERGSWLGRHAVSLHDDGPHRNDLLRQGDARRHETRRRRGRQVRRSLLRCRPAERPLEPHAGADRSDGSQHLELLRLRQRLLRAHGRGPLGRPRSSRTSSQRWSSAPAPLGFAAALRGGSKELRRLCRWVDSAPPPSCP